MRFRQRKIRAKSNFQMIIDNPKVSLGVDHGSLYTRRKALNDFYHKKGHAGKNSRKVIFLEAQVKTFINPTRRNQFTKS